MKQDEPDTHLWNVSRKVFEGGTHAVGDGPLPILPGRVQRGSNKRRVRGRRRDAPQKA